MKNYPDIRVGIGYDVHRLIKHEKIYDQPYQNIRLGGIDIPHNMKLEGHSDADVVLHAITDALLGAIGKGDIGQHFSPNDDMWLNQDSSLFLEKSMEFVKQAGGVVNNIDVTIIAEAPKIAPYQSAMAQKISSSTKIDPQRINIKATTTEKLGITGRKEGIAAQAVVSVIILSDEND